ncbi:hypothetical protein N7532_007116 [Penicillium argentinense]|uniref:Conidiation protein Con-6 n=1 Tax=Penicillium argentinense TaxID=1131581 RepID=A0A9W9FH41_9EURO|nr:uncharacterized protein N7532_007116 [Penicillium argentinense]KAJ5100115.1 hypothetical protein N7532_007116 [Penicillium argentinense]
MSRRFSTSAEERINAARGYKAALHNEHVSAEAKQHARDILHGLNEQDARRELSEENMRKPYHRHQRRSSGGKTPDSPQERINAARGYKAATHNPLVSEEGKQQAGDMLQRMDDEGARQEIYHQEERTKDPIRVAAGLKAAQRNPLVSEDGRHRAADQLYEL